MLARHALWDRVAGCLHGLLIGDALGCPIEGWTPEQIEAEYGRVESMLESSGRNWRPRGLHSDDGQQALAVLDAICRDSEHPERPFAELMVEMRNAAPQRAGRFGLHRGVGRNFRHTVRGLQAGIGNVHDHATPSAGNGAAMRIAPVPLWWRDDPQTRDRRVVQLSAVTHSDLRGISGALTLSAAIAHSLVSRPLPVLTHRFVEEIEKAEREAAEQLGIEFDARFSMVLRGLVDERRRNFSLHDLLEGIARRARTEGGAIHDVEASSAFAPCSVLTALVIVDFCTSFKAAVTTAVNLGDDTDTVGAMVGALAGAKYGLPTIPQEWLDELRATGNLFERIEQIIDREPGACRPDLLTLETQWDGLFEARPKPKFRKF